LQISIYIIYFKPLKRYSRAVVRYLLGSVMLWLVNIAVALLVAVNTVAWGLCIREVGEPKLSIEFLAKLILNKWFVLAMASAFTASILSYIVLQKMGVLAGRFFLALGIITTILVGTLVLGEKLTLREWAGIALIMVGVFLIGNNSR
jgi:undecaprenyl phosphate-alpha-L-ara4N flippase subunit ArnE